MLVRSFGVVVREVIVVAALSFACGCADHGPARAPSAHAGTPFASEQGGFKVSFPAREVRERVENAGTSEEERTALASNDWGSSSDVFVASYMDVADLDRVPRDEWFERIVDDGTKGLKETFRRRLVHAGLHGVEYEVQGEGRLTRLRLLVAGNRLFTLAVETSRAQAPDSTAGYFASFALSGPVPRGIRRVDSAHLEFMLPNERWFLAASAEDSETCSLNVFLRNDSGDPSNQDKTAAQIVFCAEAAPANLTSDEHAERHKQRDPYEWDARQPAPPLLPGSALWRAHREGEGGRRDGFLLFHAQHGLAVAVAAEAPAREFGKLEAELVSALRSIRPDPPPASSE
jgi:hypothetical protein